MKVSVHGGAPHARKVDVLVLGVAGDGKTAVTLSGAAADVDQALSGVLAGVVKDEAFTGKAGKTLVVHTHGHIAARRVVLLGLGETGKLTQDGLRTAAGHAVNAANAVKGATVGLVLPSIDGLDDDASIRTQAEGSILAAYAFDKYLSKKNENTAAEVELLGFDAVPAGADAAIEAAHNVSNGVMLARDLVNEPAGTLNPEAFADRMVAMGKDVGLSVDVLMPDTLKQERMNLLLAVAAAATPYSPPRVVRLGYTPKGEAKKHIVLVGKGLTFDCGGLDIKPAAGMLDMKMDMGGAAAVAGAMMAIAKLAPEGVAVTGYLGLVENGIGGNAYHPGDVIVSRKGISVEVNNTDAEGRLVMADVIDYAIEKESPDTLIDLATLTGACMVALGPHTAGLMSEVDGLVDAIKTSGEAAGEDFWRLPLNKKLDSQLKSKIADTKNTGERWGGAITAGLFLSKFVDGRADWAHIDIAGPTLSSKAEPYQPAGGTGFAVRTLAGFLAG